MAGGQISRRDCALGLEIEGLISKPLGLSGSTPAGKVVVLSEEMYHLIVVTCSQHNTNSIMGLVAGDPLFGSRPWV